MASEKLPINLIGLYQDAFMREAGSEGSVDSSQVSSIMKSVGLNPSEAEIQVGSTKVKKYIILAFTQYPFLETLKSKLHRGCVQPFRNFRNMIQ